MSRPTEGYICLNNASTNLYIYFHIYTYIYIQTKIYIYIYNIYMCVCVCVFIYIYIYISLTKRFLSKPLGPCHLRLGGFGPQSRHQRVGHGPPQAGGQPAGRRSMDRRRRSRAESGDPSIHRRAAKRRNQSCNGELLLYVRFNTFLGMCASMYACCACSCVFVWGVELGGTSSHPKKKKTEKKKKTLFDPPVGEFASRLGTGTLVPSTSSVPARPSCRALALRIFFRQN